MHMQASGLVNPYATAAATGSTARRVAAGLTVAAAAATVLGGQASAAGLTDLSGLSDLSGLNLSAVDLGSAATFDLDESLNALDAVDQIALPDLTSAPLDLGSAATFDLDDSLDALDAVDQIAPPGSSSTVELAQVYTPDVTPGSAADVWGGTGDIVRQNIGCNVLNVCAQELERFTDTNGQEVRRIRTPDGEAHYILQNSPGTSADVLYRTSTPPGHSQPNDPGAPGVLNPGVVR